VEHIMANEKQTGGSDRGGSGNFANDPQRASEAGKKGGSHSHSGGSQQDQGAAAGEAGKKGGEHSHGGHKADHK
jgi:general stress protein YciG